MGLETEESLLRLAEQALEAENAEAAARYLRLLEQVQEANPLPMPSRAESYVPLAPSDTRVDWLANQARLELSRSRYKGLSRFEAAAQGARRLRAVEAEEQAHNRPGYAFRTGLVATELEELAKQKPAPLLPLVKAPAPVDGGHGLSRNWKEHARQVPIAQVFGAIGVTRRRRRWAPCPACQKTKPHVEVYADKNTWKCFRCQEGGSTLDAVSWALLRRAPSSPEDWEQVGAWFAREAL